MLLSDTLFRILKERCAIDEHSSILQRPFSLLFLYDNLCNIMLSVLQFRIYFLGNAKLPSFFCLCKSSFNLFRQDLPSLCHCTVQFFCNAQAADRPHACLLDLTAAKCKHKLNGHSSHSSIYGRRRPGKMLLCLCQRRRIIADIFYCKRSNPEDTAELDACAKKNGVTLTSVGIQDVVWLNLFTTISAACHKMDKVIGRAVADQNIYGEEATKGIGFGLTEEQFRNRTDAGDIDPDWFGRTLEAIISKLGMTPTKYSSFLEPVLAEHDTHYDGGNRDIKAGLVRGWNQISEIETAEGTVFRSEFISKICDPDEPEYHGFEIQGQPNLSVMIPGLEPPYIICSSMVNRVPDVINAKPGFISLDEMPTPQYRPGSYEKYID